MYGDNPTNKNKASSAGLVWRSKHFDATRGCHARKIRSEFPVVIPEQIFGAYPYGVASRSGTRHPGIGWRARHIHMDHLSRLQFDEEESKKRAKEEIGHL